MRIDRLAEALAVVKGLFADEPCHFEGKHYQVRGLEGTPKPLQRPHPPIVIGGGGKRVLSLAGREADVVAVNMNMPKGVIDASVGPTPPSRPPTGRSPGSARPPGSASPT